MEIVLDKSKIDLSKESVRLIGTYLLAKPLAMPQTILLKILGLQGWKGFHFVDGVDGTIIVGRGVDDYPISPVHIEQVKDKTFRLNFIERSMTIVELTCKNPSQISGKLLLKGIQYPLVHFKLSQVSTSPYYKA